MGTMKRGLLAAVASSLVLLTVAAVPAFCQPDASNRPYRTVTAEMFNNPPASEWLQYRRTNDGHGYSHLKLINTANVKDLEPIWSFSTGLTKGHEVVPVYHDGILFVVASYDVVYALDARSGKFIWKYERDIPDKALSVVCCDVVNKGGVLYGDNFIYETIDAHLVALNAKTGAVAWDTKIADYADGITGTAAPLVANGNIIAGMTGGEFGARGRLIAVNAETGQLAWVTYTIPGPGEPGNDTWGAGKGIADKDTYKHGGGTTWTTGYYDLKNDIIWWPTGNPGPWAAYVRPGANAGSSSLVAFDGKTGAIKGMYQTVIHDMWDYDNISQPFSIDYMKNGKEVHATFETHKDGYTYVIDRDPAHFGPYGGNNWENVPAIYVKPFMKGITWTKGNLDSKMHPLYDPAKDSTTPNLVDVCPSFLGGTNYLVPSYDAATHTAYISGNYWCETIKGLPIQPWAPYKAYVYAEFHMHVMPGISGGGGWIKAIDVTDGRTKWEHDMVDSNWSGLVATDGGVLFGGGTATRDFFALNKATGKLLWKFKTNSGMVGAPITYEIDGVQYVATVSGFGGAIPIWTGEIKEKFNKNVPQGGVVWVFALRK
jgi:alcohol dehydrogenase (cytochrome c)